MRGFPWGGSEELWSRAALKLQEAGHAVAFHVSYDLSAPRIREILGKGGRFFSADKKGLFRKSFQSGLVSNFKPDLVVISQGMNLDGVQWMEECILKRAPFITLAQNASSIHFWQDEEILRKTAAAMERAAGHYFVSENNLKLTRMQLSIPLAKAKVVRNPFLVDYHTNLPWPDSKIFKLACVSRLFVADKGQDILLEALGSAKWKDRPLEVTLFGSGPHQNMLENHAKHLGLKNLRFGGSQEPLSIWKTHHALVLPSRVEGMPLAMIEAMLCARPVIATKVGGVPELLEENVSGFMADAAEAGCIDEALERAWHARDKWQQMGKAAAEKAREAVPEDPAGVFAAEIMGFIR